MSCSLSGSWWNRIQSSSGFIAWRMLSNTPNQWLWISPKKILRHLTSTERHALLQIGVSRGWASFFCRSTATVPMIRHLHAALMGGALFLPGAGSLDKFQMFVLGCQDLIVTTDHEPLKGIFGDRDLSKVANPCVFRLKERTLWYRFRIQHRQGKWHRGSDAMSRHPATAVRAVMQVCLSPPSSSDLSEADCVESCVRPCTVEAMAEYGDDLGAIFPDMIRAAGWADQSYMALGNTIEAGFPGKRNLLNPEIREFWDVRNRLSTDDGLILPYG